VRLWQRRIVARQDVVPALFYFTFAFGSAALVDVTAGNIAIFEQLLLWLGFAALLSRRWWTFALLVVVAAQAKLTPVFFLGLLLVIDERPRWSPFLGGSLLFALAVGANAVLLPTRRASSSPASPRSASADGRSVDAGDDGGPRGPIAWAAPAAARGDGPPALPRRGRDDPDTHRALVAHAARGGGERAPPPRARHVDRVRARDAADEGLLVRGAAARGMVRARDTA
jgi:hypothetical protein